MECVIDTNVIVYDMLEDAELHIKAKQGLDGIDTCLVPVTVIEELSHVLARLGAEDKMIRGKIKEILQNDSIISIEKDTIESATEIVDNEAISFNDKLILSIAKAKGAPLFTFDAKLRKQCKANGVKLLYA